MKQKTINVYEFDELKPEIQERVLEHFRENEEFSFLKDYLEEDLSEELRKNKIKEMEETTLRYSLSNCQGDGLSFIGLFKWKCYIIRIKEGSLSNLYSHKYTTDILIETNAGNEVKPKIEKEFEEIYFKICDKLEKIGYKYIEETLSEGNIKENIGINEYTFRDNGEIEAI